MAQRDPEKAETVAAALEMLGWAPPLVSCSASVVRHRGVPGRETLGVCRRGAAMPRHIFWLLAELQGSRHSRC
jgi:hypothetical protein